MVLAGHRCGVKGDTEMDSWRKELVINAMDRRTGRQTAARWGLWGGIRARGRIEVPSYSPLRMGEVS